MQLFLKLPEQREERRNKKNGDKGWRKTAHWELLEKGVKNKLIWLFDGGLVMEEEEKNKERRGLYQEKNDEGEETWEREETWKPRKKHGGRKTSIYGEERERSIIN